MSTRIMALCWPLQMPPTAKAVLISLADNANDSGYCWPSIETICERTCFSRRAVIDAIHWLEAEKYVTADRSNGRKTAYWVTPDQCSSRTGAADAPVQQAHKTGAPAALDRCSSRTLTVKNRQEPSTEEGARSPRGSRLPSDFPTAECLDWCRQERPDLDADDLRDKFRDYWCAVPGARGRKSDWPATWRNFVRSEFARGRPPARASPGRSAAVESGLALAGLSRKPEVVDVTPTAAARLGR